MDQLDGSVVADDRMPEVTEGLSGRRTRLSDPIRVIRLGNMNQRIEVRVVVLAHRAKLRLVLSEPRV